MNFGVGRRCLRRCFRFDVRHVELQHRRRVRLGRLVAGRLFDRYLRGRRFRELVDQCELGRCLAGYRRLFVAGDRLIRCRRDQRNEADVRAVTYAL